MSSLDRSRIYGLLRHLLLYLPIFLLVFIRAVPLLLSKDTKRVIISCKVCRLLEIKGIGDNRAIKLLLGYRH